MFKLKVDAWYSNREKALTTTVRRYINMWF